MADVAFFRLATPSASPDHESIEEDLLSDSSESAFLSSAGPTDGLDHEKIYEDFGGFVLIGASSLADTGEPLGDGFKKEDALTYTVKEGDTLSSIAKTFGISVGDILESNNVEGSLIRPGEELAILPVSKSGASIAHSVAPAETEIQNTYFIRPIDGGLNWGILHGTKDMPAVDFAKACGSDVYAAAAGTVVKVGSPELYNNGYGGYVLLSHPNGTRTVYAHNSENLVGVGDKVEQGELIARIGNTGLTYGPTGCHVHFGVSGMPNPFVR